DRLRTRGDEASWREFVGLYEGVVARFARRMGVAEDAVQDIVQDTFMVLAQHMRDFRYDPERGHFRSWLYQVVASRVSRHWRGAVRNVRSAGGTAADAALREVPDPHSSQGQAGWEDDWRRARLDYALARARERVEPRTWQSFERYVLREEPADRVAGELSMSVGMVYVNKARILRMMRRILETTDE
ncbi:MAG: hypothetical protein AMK73_08785, partial [Planctomycetes bacterium SM23_32]